MLALSGCPITPVFAGRTSSAVMVRSWRVSLPRSPAGSPLPAKTVRAYDSRRPATPAAWPVFSDPVVPIRTMSALPPYWVRLELRKKLVVNGCAVGVTPMLPKPSRNC